MAYKWYFVRCQSGREDSIRKQLETRINVKGLQEVVPQVLVPFERVTELKSGKRKVVSKKLYPGYLMVQADFSDPEDSKALEARATLRETPGFGDFLGSRGEPTPLTEAQVSQILARAKAGVDVQEVLDAIAVIRLQVNALFPGGIDPQGGDAQALQIVQLAGDALDRAAVETRARRHPTHTRSRCQIGKLPGSSLDNSVVPQHQWQVGREHKLVRSKVRHAYPRFTVDIFTHACIHACVDGR